MAQQNPDPTQTVVIDNFTGSLTRTRFGDMNSGLAQFDTSFGYDPFNRPRNLTWFKNLTTISSDFASGLLLAGASRIEGANTVTYIITSTGRLYREVVAENNTTNALVRALVTGTPTFTYGADITFFGLNTLYISHDLGLTKIVIDASGAFVSETVIGTWDSTHFTPITTRRSMVQFLGLLYVINSDASVTYANNIAEVTVSGTVNTYAKLSPSLPQGTFIRDLDLSVDLNYMIISSSLTPSELIAPNNDAGNGGGTSSTIYQWNGVDVGITAGTTLPGFGITATNTFLSKQMSFLYDTFGSSVMDGGQKVLTMKNNKSPMPSAVVPNGNFITWANPEYYYNLDTAVATNNASLYYYGNLDAENPPGLWRVFRLAAASGGGVYQVPYQSIVTNRYTTLDGSENASVSSWGIHLFSLSDVIAGPTSVFRAYTAVVSGADYPISGNNAIGGVYETQTQLFGKKITIKQIRVYVDSMINGTGFNLDLIGADGKKITNGSFNYTWTAGTDPTLLQGNPTRIDFNPAMMSTYACGVRVTNAGDGLGTIRNFAINKIEVDWQYSGK